MFTSEMQAALASPGPHSHTKERKENYQSALVLPWQHLGHVFGDHSTLQLELLTLIHNFILKHRIGALDSQPLLGHPLPFGHCGF